jgi:hypothetical protein
MRIQAIVTLFLSALAVAAPADVEKQGVDSPFTSVAQGRLVSVFINGLSPPLPAAWALCLEAWGISADPPAHTVVPNFVLG